MQNFVKKILFISPFIPYPLNSGGNQAVFSMIDYLRKIHSVSILIRAGHQKDIDALKRVWPDVGFFIYSKKEGKRKSWLPLRAHVLHCLSSSFTRKYNRIFFKYWPSRPNVDKMLRIRTLINLRPSELDPGYCEFVHNVAESGFDIIQTEFRELLDLCYFLPENAVKVYVQHEIDYIRRGNELAMLQSPTLMDIARYQQAKDKEISMLSRYDYIITLTATDKNILSKYIPEEKIYVSPAVIKMDRLVPFKTCTPEFVFVGGSDHFPNYDGVNWFCECILPVLKENLSDFKIYIIGNWSRKAKRTIHKHNKEVEFMGFVEDLHTFLNGKITIVPIRIGSGMRMKILDAVWSSSPFITTSKGVEGQDFTNGIDCIIADSPQEFGKAMVMLSSDTVLQKSLSENAVIKVKKYYNPEAMMKIRADFYAKFTANIM